MVDYASVGWMADVDLAKASLWIATILVISLWLPAAILTALLVAAVLAMPLLVGHVARRDFPSLQRRNGGTFPGSAWNAGAAICVFCLLWIATLPLRLLGPLAAWLRWMPSAWLNQRLFRYDALAEHADAGERVRITDYARGRLFLLGLATGACSTSYCRSTSSLAFIHSL